MLRELRPRDSDEQLRRVVDLRMQRQRLLDQDPPLDLWLILDEGAIRRNIGGTAVMRPQLEHLVQASRWSNVTLQILAFESGAHAGLIGPFSILEFPERDRLRRGVHRIRGRHDLPGKRPGSPRLRRGL